MKAERDQSTVLFLSLFAVLLIPFSLTWWGYVLHLLWAWFVVPLGAVEIGVAHGIGLSCVVALFRGRDNDDDEKDPVVRILTSLFLAAFKPAWVLLVGAIVQEFML